MPIKKRSNTKIEDVPVHSEKLVIVAKPKKPLPEQSATAHIFGNAPAPAGMRRLGLIAQSCGDEPDASLTVTDRVSLMRTPYDKDNLQEARYRNRVRNRGTGITAMCITCQGTQKAVKECLDTQCPLWAFRFGSDPFYGKSKK